VEEGAEGPGGLGEPGDIGTGPDVGTGASGTGSPTGTGTKTRTGEEQGSGTKPGGKKGGSKGGLSHSGDGDGTNPGDPSVLGYAAAAAALVTDPGSLYNAKQSGNKGTSSQLGRKNGIISGWIAQVLTIVMVAMTFFATRFLKAVRSIFRKLGEGLSAIRNKLFGSIERKAVAEAERKALTQGEKSLAHTASAETGGAGKTLEQARAEFIENETKNFMEMGFSEREARQMATNLAENPRIEVKPPTGGSDFGPGPPPTIKGSGRYKPPR
jgi:hypothetical protein